MREKRMVRGRGPPRWRGGRRSAARNAETLARRVDLVKAIEHRPPRLLLDDAERQDDRGPGVVIPVDLIPDLRGVEDASMDRKHRRLPDGSDLGDAGPAHD